VNGQGKIMKQVESHGYYALVDVTCIESGDQSSSATFSSSILDDWMASQGWIDAALTGARIGLHFACSSATCIITRIHGMPCDTNSTLVAIAGIRAVWDAINFEPDQPTADLLEQLILRSSRLSVGDLMRELRQ
jgi:hypothetical protein